jgi:hypothetical protein
MVFSGTFTRFCLSFCVVFELIFHYFSSFFMVFDLILVIAEVHWAQIPLEKAQRGRKNVFS